MNSLVILSYKKRSETMATHVRRILLEAEIDPHIKLTYAGRLDPMAEGLVVLLVGEMRFQKPAFLGFQKTYEVEFFFGYETDTYDVLGIAQKNDQPNVSGVEQLITQAIKPQTINQRFPSFSSRRVSGKPLFVHARENTQVPEQSHGVEILSGEFLGARDVSRQVFWDEVVSGVSAVVGDFRQQDCLDSWERRSDTFPEHLTLYQVRLAVSAGFYVRQWVSDLGQTANSSAVTFSIKRVTLGMFTVDMLQGLSHKVFLPDDPLILSRVH